MRKKLKLLYTNRIVFLLPLLFLFFFSCSSEPSIPKKVFRIGVDQTWYPLQLAGKQRNLVGFTRDLFQEISKREHFQISIESTSTQGLLIGLQLRNYDGIISALSPTPIADEIYDFSDPYYLIGPVLVIQKSSPIKAIGDISDKVIGVLSTSPLIFTIEQHPPFLLRTFETIPRLLGALEAGQIDGVLLNALVAYLYTEGIFASSLKVLTTPLTNEGLRIVTLDKDPDGLVLIRRFNAGLKEVKNDGTYQQLLNKWDLIDTQRLSERGEALQVALPP